MTVSIIVRAAPMLICGALAVAAARASEFPTPLPADPPLKVEKLPAKYPTGWAFLNYAGDRIELRNVGGDSREVKGAAAGARFGDAAGGGQAARDLRGRHGVVARRARHAHRLHHDLRCADAQSGGRDRAARRQARADHGDGRDVRLHRRSAPGAGIQFHPGILGHRRRSGEAPAARARSKSPAARSCIPPAIAASRRCARAAPC